MEEKFALLILFLLTSTIVASVNLSQFMIYKEYSILTCLFSVIAGNMLTVILIEYIKKDN